MEQQLKKRRNNEEMGYGCALKDEEFGEWSHQHYGISNGSKLAIGLMQVEYILNSWMEGFNEFRIAPIFL